MRLTRTSGLNERVSPPKADLSGLVSNTALLMIGACVAHGINFAGLTLAARIYRPEAFGGFSAFSAIMIIGMYAATMRFDAVIPFAQDDSGAKNLAVLAIALAAAWSIIAYIGL